MDSKRQYITTLIIGGIIEILGLLIIIAVTSWELALGVHILILGIIVVNNAEKYKHLDLLDESLDLLNKKSDKKYEEKINK
jgi:hypothetical protein